MTEHQWEYYQYKKDHHIDDDQLRMAIVGPLKCMFKFVKHNLPC